MEDWLRRARGEWLSCFVNTHCTHTGHDDAIPGAGTFARGLVTIAGRRSRRG